jgi:hypothetical protein
MKKWMMVGLAMVAVAVATPLNAQLGGRLSLAPYVGYGFFGELPETDIELGAALSYGGRVGYQFAEQWSAFGNFQRSRPEVGESGTKLDIDHWSAGIEFAYVPRGGAEGMLPVLLEAGLGQARYEGEASDLAVNLGIASAFELSPNLRIRYGVNDYISNYGDDNGIVSQIFAQIGAEFTL